MNDVLLVDKKEFEINSLDDEIRVDNLCGGLLQRFYRYLLDKDIVPGNATALASGADYFTRDFVIARKQKSIFEEQPGMVRQFAGNWYITNTLEPDIGELSTYLDGVKTFYRFLHEYRLISDQFLSSVERECDDGAFYEERIKSFWEIRDDGYFAWESECTLKDGE
jgi:hypothetical protein